MVLSAALTLRGEYRGPRILVYIFKPLATGLIILMALLISNPVSTFYKYMILSGLVFSLFGDVFLMLPADRFIMGLVSFLIAHLFYIAAFSFTGSFSISFLNLIPFLIFGIFIFGMLRPHLVNLKLPVLVYMLVILVMSWQALNRWSGSGHPESWLAFLGALFFIASDTILAIDRFKTKFRHARFYVLTTYFIAQWLIAFSISSHLRNMD